MIDILELVYIMIFAPVFCAAIITVSKLTKFKLPSYGNFVLSLVSSLVCLFLSVILFGYTYTYHGYVLESNFPVCAIQNILLYFGIYVDNPSCLFIIFSSLLFFITNIFSYRYLLQNRQGFERFYIYLNITHFFTYCFFIRSNLVQSVVFLMAQTLMLYLFSNFYFQKPISQENSKKVFITNITADFMILCACCAFLYFSTITADTITIPTLGYNNINSLGLYSFAGLNPLVFIFICILFMLGTIIKSGQFPFSRSISMATQAPNPVFSIIISPVVLASGVFLLLRLFPLLNLTPALFEILKIFGITSAILAALSAAKENEIKNICAKMAISQLGIAFCTLGFKMYNTCVFLILCSGFAIALISYTLNTVNYSTGSQDNIKFLGGLREKIPFAAAAYLVGAVSLCGFTFSGFYPRAFIFNNFYMAGNFIYLILLLICSFVSAFYIFRVYFRIFEGNYRGTFEPKVVGKAMNFGIIALIIPTIFFGYISIKYTNVLFAFANQTNFGNSNPFVNVFAFLTSAAGYYLAYNIYFTKRLYSLRIRTLRRLAARYFYGESFMDFIQNNFLIFLSNLLSFFEKYILAFLYKLPNYILRFSSYIAIKSQANNVNSGYFRFVLWICAVALLTCLIYFKTGTIR